MDYLKVYFKELVDAKHGYLYVIFFLLNTFTRLHAQKNEEKVVDSELATILTTSRFKQSFNITNAPDATPETKDPVGYSI